MLDGAARVGDLFDGCAEMGMPAIAVTDHGNLFGAYEFYKASRGSGVKPIVGLEAYVTPKTHRSERKRVRWGDAKSEAASGDDVSGGGAFTHMTLWAQNTAGMHNLFRLGSRASLEGYFYKPRMDRELLQTYAPRSDRDHRLPVGGGPDLPAAGPLRRRPGQCGGVPGPVRGRQLLRRADGPRAEDRKSGPDRAARDRPATCTCRWSRPTICTTPPRRDAAAHEVLLCVQTGATMADANRFKLEGGQYYLKSPTEMRRLFAELPEACDKHLGHRRTLRHLLHRGHRHLHAPVPLPAGRERGLLVRARGGGRTAPSVPDRDSRPGPPTGRLRDRRHPLDGLRRLLPGRRRLHHLGQGARHPGRSRPRLGPRIDGGVRDADHRPRPASARTDLRTVPQPRPGLDARLRHRLRRAPARRGDPLRHRQVRRGPGQSDRHLRHDQGQAGGQGRLPGARLSVRDGGAADQGDAGPGDG